ncbi:MAG TPA: hypothetical protein VNO75_10990 [Gemmatimonadaceae bacterium]|nr:hypothetical protein [Gemmatimonadaceae bacterium]
MKILVALVLCALAVDEGLSQETAAIQADTAYIEYSDPPLTLPLGLGFRVPSYDRVNGLSLPWGPKLRLGNDRIEIDAIVTYRSNLGDLDPSIEAEFRPGYGNELEVFVGRGTFTNDAWIRSGLVNSAAVLFFGSDARNYYRADRAEARFTRTLTISATTLTPFIGGNIEEGWSTGSLDPERWPWSAFGRNGDLKMRRPNPPVFEGRINSALAGTGLELFRGELEARLEGTVEHAFKSPWLACVISGCTMTDESFTQGTVHATVNFPTFGTQTFAFRTHAVLGGDFVPPQRYAYVGGAGSLPTVDLLSLGGDRLFFAEADYKIPLERIVIRPVGSPFIALHYAAGSAGIGELPRLIQNLGVGAGISLLRVDYSIDPASERSGFSRRSAFSAGLALSF